MPRSRTRRASFPEARWRATPGGQQPSNGETSQQRGRSFSRCEPRTDIRGIGGGSRGAGQPRRQPRGEIEHARLAVIAQPRDGELRCLFATALAREKRLDEAEAEYREVIRLRPRFGEGYRDWASSTNGGGAFRRRFLSFERPRSPIRTIGTPGATSRERSQLSVKPAKRSPCSRAIDLDIRRIRSPRSWRGPYWPIPPVKPRPVNNLDTKVASGDLTLGGGRFRQSSRAESIA
jgi:hypothetical protein